MAVPLLALIPEVVELIVAAVAWVARRKAWEWVVANISFAALSGFFQEESESLQAALGYRVRNMISAIAEKALGLAVPAAGALESWGWSQAISSKCGVPLRDITNRETTIEDLEQFAVDRISKKTGYKLSTLRDPEKLKADFAQIAKDEFVRRAEIPIRDWSSREAIQADVMGWAQTRVTAAVAADLSRAYSLVNDTGVSIADQIKTFGPLVKQDLQAAASSAAVAAAVRTLAAVQNDTKRDRRRLQNMAAQAKFRSKHGNRMEYIPLGGRPKFSGG